MRKKLNVCAMLQCFLYHFSCSTHTFFAFTTDIAVLVVRELLNRTYHHIAGAPFTSHHNLLTVISHKRIFSTKAYRKKVKYSEWRAKEEWIFKNYSNSSTHERSKVHFSSDIIISLQCSGVSFLDGLKIV